MLLDARIGRPRAGMLGLGLGTVGLGLGLGTQGLGFTIYWP